MKTLLGILKGIKNGLSKAFRKVKSSKRLHSRKQQLKRLELFISLWN